MIDYDTRDALAWLIEHHLHGTDQPLGNPCPENIVLAERIMDDFAVQARTDVAP